MSRLRTMHRRSKTNRYGEHALGFGIRVGYWPCLHAPFIAVDWMSHRWEIWYGAPSYLTEEERRYV